MSDATGGTPLVRLFLMASTYFIDALHERLRALGWDDVRPAFGFALLAARSESTTTGELAALMGTTKQAASKLAAAMVTAGYLEPHDDPGDGRRRPLTLTPRGAHLLADVEQIYRELEGGWADAVGANEIELVRSTLTQAILSVHDELPPVRPAW